MRDYLPFIAANARFLAFGFLAALLSSFGQTFFIALFGGELRADYGLSHGGYGTIYSVATLVSGLTLMWLGGRLDHAPLRGYTAAVCLGLAAACGLLAVAPTVTGLALAIFALRLTGQGLLSHLAIVSMARGFGASRGKAVSVAAMGHPAGEAVLPALAVALGAALGWRGAWLLFAGFLAVAMVPLMLWLLRPATAAGPGQPETAPASRKAEDRPADRGVADLMRDPLFYPLIVAMLAPSFIVTGVFFHQVALAESRDWSLSWLATCFVGYAAAQVTAGLLAGPLVDRLGSVRLLPTYMLPLGAGTLVLALSGHPLAALAYMLLAGSTAGVNFTILGAVWAEVYGTRRLGAIRALVQALLVLATAAAPVLFGTLLDRGVGFGALAGGCALYVLAACLILLALQPPLRRRTAPA